MSPRTRRTLVLLSLLLLATSAFAGRRRAVRVPAPECSYSLSYSLPDPVSDLGVTRARVDVTPSNPAQCAGWATVADVDWITVETSSTENASFITIARNATGQPRAGHVRIGGTTLSITQTAALAPPDNNLVKNGTFNIDLSSWGWPARFPNGTGDATWATFDANNSMTSGSIRLRDDINSGPAYQQMQCITLEPGTYEYGLAVRVPSRSVIPIMTLVKFFEPNCGGNYTYDRPVEISVTRLNQWERFSYVTSVNVTTSVGVTIAAWARDPGVQEAWIDDVYVRLKPGF